MESTPGTFPLFETLVAFFPSDSVGGLVSVVRSSGDGGGRRVHLYNTTETFGDLIDSA